MRKKRICSVILVVALALSLVFSQSLVGIAAQQGDLKVQMSNGNTAATTSGIQSQFILTNTTGAGISLSDVKLRYYYTIDGEKAQNFWCDWSSVGSANVTGSFVKMSNPVDGADYYLEIGFTGSAGTLAAGQSIHVQARFAKSDWSSYTQSNDYSFNATASSAVDWNKVNAYIGGTIVWGSELGGGGVNDSTISPSSVTFDKKNPADIAITLTPKTNTFVGITGLTAGTHYTVSGNTVTLKQSYLSTLAVGASTLTFDFSAGTDPKLTVNVIDSSVTPTGNLSVKTYNMNTSATTGGVSAKFVLTNTGSTGITLSNVKLRYYYTIDGERSQNFWCDWSSIGGANVTGTFVKMTSTASTADYYLEVGFAGAAGTLATGQSAEVQVRFSKDDWSNYTQTNDYSFNASATSAVDWTKITAYISGTLVYGVEPVGGGTVNDSTISPATATFDKYIPADVSTTVTFNGNTLASIKNGTTALVSGTDYTVSGSTVKISKSYLSKFAAGTAQTLTFTFSAGKTASLVISIIDSTPSADGLKVIIGTGEGKPGEEVTIPVSFKDVPAASIGNCDFKLAFDTSLLEVVSVSAGSIVKNADVNFAYAVNTTTGTISFLFLDNTIGSELITGDGIFANITFKLKSVAAKTTTPVTLKSIGAFADKDLKTITATFTPGSVVINPGSIEDPDALKVIIGTGEGKPGEEVTIPVSFKDVPAASIGNCDFKLAFDTSLLEVVSVSAGSIVKNADVNFAYAVNTTTGTISFLFLDNTIGSELITGDGIFANITFKLKSVAAKTTTPVTLKSVGAFADKDLKTVTAEFTPGSVVINPEDIVVPDEFKVEIGAGEGKSGEEVIIPVSFDAVPATSIGNCDFKLGFDTSLLEVVSVSAGSIVKNAAVNFAYAVNTTTGTISFLFLDNTIGSELITADGVFANITFKLKSVTAKTTTPVTLKSVGAFADKDLKTVTATFTPGSVVINPEDIVVPDEFKVEIGAGEGKSGEEVIIPVSFDAVPATSIGNCDFKLGFDTSLLEVVSVSAGSIVKNAAVNFAYAVNTTTGTISFLFLDNTIGSELITTDGVFANITFKLKSVTAKTTTPIALKSVGAFADKDLKTVTATFTPGSVVINPADAAVVDSTISPAAATFDKYAPADVSTTMTLNGNTLAGITNGSTALVAGTDYTVSGSTVKISKTYLAAFAKDTVQTLTFTFSAGKAATLAISIVDTTPVVVDEFKVEIGAGEGKSGEEVTIPVSFSGVPAASIGNCDFKLGFDTSLLEVVSVSAGSIVKNAPVNFASAVNTTTGTISFLFLDNTIGSELITTDGVFANITFKLKSVTAKTTTPVALKSVGAFADKDLKSVTATFAPGSVVINPADAVVVDSTISPAAATFDKYAPADVSTTMTLNGNTLAGIANGSTALVAGTDYTVSGSTVKVSKTYLAAFAKGTSQTLTFTFSAGKAATLAISIVDSTPSGLNVTIGTASAAAGETVAIPVKLVGVPSTSIGNCDFKLSFDTSLLEVASITAGDIIINAPVNFASAVNATTGTISFLFLDNTIGSQLISSDGTFATINFTVKSGAAAGTTEIKLKSLGAFADKDLKNVAVTFGTGSITIK